MFTHLIEIGSPRNVEYTIVYVAQRQDGYMILFNPSQDTLRVLGADEFNRTQRRHIKPIPGGIVAGAGKTWTEIVADQFQRQVVSRAVYPEEWTLAPQFTGEELVS